MARLFNDGDSEYLEIDQAVIAAPPNSCAAQIYSDNVASEPVVIQGGDKSSNQHRWGLTLRGDVDGDPVGAYTQVTSYSRTDTTTGYSANTWHHVAGVWYDATNRSAFIDGGSKDTNPAIQTILGQDRFSIGRNGRLSPGNYFSGSIAEAAVWNIALTDAEVAILAAGYSPLFVHPQNLVFYMPLVRDNDEDIVGVLSLTAFSGNSGPGISAHPRIIRPAMFNLGLTIGAAPPAGVVVLRRRRAA